MAAAVWMECSSGATAWACALRTPPTTGMMAGGMASNVKRTMTGGRVAAILFDKTYSEHLNLAGNADFGYPGGTRINEPGRTLWLRADVKF